ncbi:MAG: hypothetical protein LEGION0403_FIIPPAGN_02898 [Legionella sp.]
MTQLRQAMQLRNLAENTQYAYINAIKQLGVNSI